MEGLSSLSEGLAGVVQAGGPSVVRVDARRRMPGSGIVWASDGTIVTAAHVVEREEPIEVGLSDGRAVQASLVGRDRTTDVAVLRAQATGLTPATWANGDAPRVGHLVVALARPGRTVRAALGIISALGDEWRTPAGGEIDRYVEADVRMSAGFSGGPLVDARGGALGLTTAGLLRRAVVAVPALTLRRVVDTLLQYGRVRRGYLGIGAHPVHLPEGLSQQLGQERGLLLVSVEPGSPAERGGLLLGDVIVAVGGQPVGRLDDLMALLGADRVGTTVPVRFIRGGQVQEVRVVVGERAA